VKYDPDKRSKRTPVVYRGARVPNLYTRELADGSVVFEFFGKRRGESRPTSKRLDATTANDARLEAQAFASGVGPTASGGRTLDDLADEALDSWKRAAVRDGRSLRGNETTAGRYAHVRPVLGRKVARDLTRSDVRRLLAVLEDGPLSPATRTGVLRTLSAVLEYGRDTDEIEGPNVARDVPKSWKPGTRATKDASRLTTEQLGDLLHFTSATYRPVVSVLAWTGLRVSEALGLTWADVDLSAGVLHVTAQRGPDGDRVPCKTSASVRDVPMPPALVRELRALQGGGNVVRMGAALMFPTLKRRGVHQAIERAAKRAGIDPASGRSCIGAHDLRHTYCSNAVQSGIPIPVVAKLAGHRDSRMLVERYAGVVGEDLSAHVAQLAASGFGA
jgi:integrase